MTTKKIIIIGLLAGTLVVLGTLSYFVHKAQNVGAQASPINTPLNAWYRIAASSTAASQNAGVFSGNPSTFKQFIVSNIPNDATFATTTGGLNITTINTNEMLLLAPIFGTSTLPTIPLGLNRNIAINLVASSSDANASLAFTCEVSFTGTVWVGMEDCGSGAVTTAGSGTSDLSLSKNITRARNASTTIQNIVPGNAGGIIGMQIKLTNVVGKYFRMTVKGNGGTTSLIADIGLSN